MSIELCEHRYGFLRKMRLRAALPPGARVAGIRVHPDLPGVACAKLDFACGTRTQFWMLCHGSRAVGVADVPTDVDSFALFPLSDSPCVALKAGQDVFRIRFAADMAPTSRVHMLGVDAGLELLGVDESGTVVLTATPAAALWHPSARCVYVASAAGPVAHRVVAGETFVCSAPDAAAKLCWEDVQRAEGFDPGPAPADGMRMRARMREGVSCAADDGAVYVLVDAEEQLGWWHFARGAAYWLPLWVLMVTWILMYV
jgi:hypothetical protein